MATARAKARPQTFAAPHLKCSVCTEQKACAWHAARTPDDFMRVTMQTLQRRALGGLSDLFEAAFATLFDLPDASLDLVADASPKALAEEFARLLEVERYNTDQLRRLAAVALALAVHYEAVDEDDEED